MTDIERPWTAEEVAEVFRVSVWTVGNWTRTGVLPRVPGIRAIRIPAGAVRQLLEGYDGERVKSVGQASSQEAPSRRRDRPASDGPLASPPLGSGSALHGRVGPSATDVVVRRVEG